MTLTCTQIHNTCIQAYSNIRTYIHTFMPTYIQTYMLLCIYIYTYMQHVDTRRDIHACTFESVDSEIGRKTDNRKIDRQIDR